jgi:hypothetical protein
MLNECAATQEVRRTLTGGQQDGRHPWELPIKSLQRFSIFSYSLHAMLCYELAGTILFSYFIETKLKCRYDIPYTEALTKSSF